MNINSLKPAGQLASTYGFKAVVYGPPGSAKTPLVNTAPRPVLLACEPGLLSMTGSNVPAWQAFDIKAIDEFFEWFFKSAEVKNFDTLAIDSISQMAEIYLQAIMNGKSASGKKLHGLAAYGEMARSVMDILRPVFFLQDMHTYLICKQDAQNDNGVVMRKPYFPGQQLHVEVPHMYDAILHLSLQNVPGVGQTKAFRCSQSIDTMARDRSGRLAEFEPPDFGALVRKAMGK